MGLPRGILWLIGIITVLLQLDIIAAQTKRSSRITSSRSFSINTKSSSGSEFDCPDEFGYYPHPNDCTQYYVCVFGGALLESCTGGLMYSHELQTCDWPRNVGCESTEIVSSSRDLSSSRLGQQQIKPQQQHQSHVPHRIRFGTLPSSTTSQPKTTIAQQYHRQTSPQTFQQHIQTLPPPPELLVAPNPVITSRGQPKPLLDSQEDIAKLYAEAHDTLPPVEEEESDRQQRVYRGQPSTLGQVQRDRDGIIHHASLNALPNHGKIGSYAYGAQLNQFSKFVAPFEFQNDNHLVDETTRQIHVRNRRDVVPTDNKNQTELQNVDNYTKDNETMQYPDERFDDSDIEYYYSDENNENGDNNSDDEEEYLRSPRQLRQQSSNLKRPNWQFVNGNYRSINSKPYPQDVYELYTPYLSPPSITAHQYYKGSHGSNVYNNEPKNKPARPQYSGSSNYKPISYKFNQQPQILTQETYLNHNPSSIFGSSTSSPHFPQSAVLPLLIEGFRNTQKPHKATDPDNFSYFHLANEELPTNRYTLLGDSQNTQYFATQTEKGVSSSKPHYHAFSTVGGFYNNNNNIITKHSSADSINTAVLPVKSTSSPISKLLPNFNIPSQLSTTTESNYFQYNILQNQRMKNFYLTSPTTTNSPRLPTSIPAITNTQRPTTTVTTSRPHTTFNNFQIVSGPDYQTTYAKDIHQNTEKFTNGISSTELYKSSTHENPTEVHKSTGFHYTTPTTTVYQTTGSYTGSSSKPFGAGNIKSKPGKIEKPASGNFNFGKFVEGIKETQIAQVDPNIFDALNYFLPMSNKSTSTSTKITYPTVHVTQSSPSFSSTLASIRAGPSTNYNLPETTSKSSHTSVLVTPKAQKGYESFINSIPQKQNQHSVVITYDGSTHKPPSTASIGAGIGSSSNPNIPNEDDYYYDNDDYDIDPPSDKPQYMPSSETMAPKPPKPITTTPQYHHQQHFGHNQQFKTGQVTTHRPVFSSHYSKENYEYGKDTIPAIISFPTDIFQNLQPIKHFSNDNNKSNQNQFTLSNWTSLTKSTTDRTVTTKSKPTKKIIQSTTATTLKPTRQKTTTTTTTATTLSITTPSSTSALNKFSTTTRKIYTIRPNRGNMKWKYTKPTTRKSLDDRKRPLQQQIELDEKHAKRVETSSHAPATPSPAANIFIPQPRPKPVAEQAVRNNNNNNNNNNHNHNHNHNNNYYNVSKQTNYDPTPFDNYYSIYDDDVDIYRDVEYNQQQQHNRPKVQQSTFRPAEIITSSQNPVRDPFASKVQIQQQQPQQHQHQQYNKPSQVYNNDYDEGSLVSQIQTESAYTQPTRAPTRSTLSDEDISDGIMPKLSAGGIPNRSNQIKSDSSNVYQSIVSSTSSISSSKSSSSLPLSNPSISLLSSPVTPSFISSSTPITLSNSQYSSSNPIRIQTVTSPTFNNQHNLLDKHHQFKQTELQRNKNYYTTLTNDSTPNTNNTERTKINIFVNGSATIPKTSISPLNNKIVFYPNNFQRDESENGSDKRKRILSYIVSDEEPQGFKPSPKYQTEITQSTPSLLPLSSTTPLYRAEIVTKPAASNVLQNTYTYSLTTGTGGFNLRTQPETDEKFVKNPPIYVRPTAANKYSNKDEMIEPTTYVPPKQWRLLRTSSTTFSSQDSNSLSETTNNRNGDNEQSDSYLSFQREQLNKNNDYVSTSGSELAPTITDKVNPERIQTFTSRALVFKDNLRSKTYETTGSTKFVSPYTSLKTILQSKDEKLKFSSVKPSFKARFTTTAPTYYTTPKPLKSVYLISSPTKEHIYFSSPTVAAIKTTLHEPSSILSTTSSTIPSTIPTTTTTTTSTTVTYTTSTLPSTTSTETAKEDQSSVFSSSLRSYTQKEKDFQEFNPRGKSRYAGTISTNSLENDEPTTYSPKFRIPSQIEEISSTTPIITTQFSEIPPSFRRKVVRPRTTTPKVYVTRPTGQNRSKSRYDITSFPKETAFGSYISQYSTVNENAKAFPLIQFKETLNSNENDTLTAQSLLFNESEENSNLEKSIEDQRIVEITDRPAQYFTRYRQLSTDRNLADAIQGYNELSHQDRAKFRATIDLPDTNIATENEYDFIKSITTSTQPITSTTTTTTPSSTISNGNYFFERITNSLPISTTFITEPISTITTTTTIPNTFKTTTIATTTEYYPRNTTTNKLTTTIYPKTLIPPRISRVNNAIKTSIAASSRTKVPSTISKCADNTPNTKCNEIPSRTSNRNRGNSQHIHYNGEIEKPAVATQNRGTHPPRSRPTLKPSGAIVSKAVEFIDIYRNPPSRAEPLYPQPTPDKTAAKCRKDVCLLPDCYCGGRDIPGDLPPESLPQIVLLTFDDSVNDLNKQLYSDLFEKGRVNPNGCPITATFYVSHEWTDYSQVQNLYSDGHEMASHTVSHSFGEQFSQKKWTREIAGQREILSAYGGVKLNDVRGMRAPFLSIGGNKMFKMLYDANFTYDSSMPVYENRPPSWPYTLDYKIFHDCMIPPCPTKSYPGVWEVPMVMWQDLNGGRCSMGDACSNPSDAENVFKMIMKNFDRHYSTNRAPFGLFYHAAWFTQPHHKEGFIKFLDAINAMSDVWIVTNWQAIQWIRDPTPISRINHFQPFQCDYSDRPKRCNNPKVCNLWHKSGVRYMRTCQPCPDIYPWTGKTGIRSSRVDNEIDE